MLIYKPKTWISPAVTLGINNYKYIKGDIEGVR